MNITKWTSADTARVQEIWRDYYSQHDVSAKAGKTAGIEPRSGSIWFGDSIQDVIAQRDNQGKTTPLFFVRVGFETYYRKGRSH